MNSTRLFLLMLLSFSSFYSVIAQNRVSPAVPGFGGIFEIPNPDEKPDASLIYNIVIDITTASESPNEINPALHNLARMMNLHVAAGVPIENMNVIGVIHSSAIFSALDNKHYQEQYEIDNPNLELIEALKKAGVKLNVCAQSLKARRFERDWVNKEIGISVSALTLVTTYQLKGFAMLKFQ